MFISVSLCLSESRMSLGQHCIYSFLISIIHTSVTISTPPWLVLVLAGINIGSLLRKINIRKFREAIIDLVSSVPKNLLSDFINSR
jgi:hypothetical protein